MQKIAKNGKNSKNFSFSRIKLESSSKHLQPAVDRQPDHRQKDSWSIISMQNYFITTPPRSILNAFLINSKHFIIFWHLYHFLTPGTSTSSPVKLYLKVYREANPSACASALCHLTPEKSKKYMLMRKKLNFLKKIC